MTAAYVGAVALAAPAQAGTVALVAQPTPPPADPGGRGEDFGKSAPVGLVVIIVFFIAVFFLVRSMNKHLRRVPESFDPPPTQQPANQQQPTANGAAPPDGRTD